jgi:hypothetical protein
LLDPGTSFALTGALQSPNVLAAAVEAAKAAPAITATIPI